MNIQQRLLRIIFGILIGCSLTLVVLFEGNFLPSGMFAGNYRQEFFYTLFMELLTIFTIPFSLRLIRSGSNLVMEENILYAWYGKRAVFRMVMLGIPLFFNTLFYYLSMKATFGYMALILLICMFFIIPTRTRYLKEIDYYSARAKNINE